MMKLIPTILLVVMWSVNLTSAQSKPNINSSIGVSELQMDLNYLKDQLESRHPNLYLYKSKMLVDRLFDDLNNNITQPLNPLDFYRQLAQTVALIGDGHTVILPGTEITKFHNTNSKFLPYHILLIGDHLYMDMSCTNEQSLPTGAEILSLNHENASDIITRLKSRQSRDGHNVTYPAWIISNYFREYYSYNYGHPENFEIEYQINGQTKAVNVRALPKDSINYYRKQNNPGKQFEKLPKEGITLRITDIPGSNKSQKYAILTIKDFHNSQLKKEYKQHFKKEIGNFFEQIQKDQIENLILDLRNNQGGDIQNGVYLLSHLLDKPFSVVEDYFHIKNKQLIHCKGPSLGMHKPNSNNYKGKLYVLINGGSFSNSGIVASCLQANNRAVFIGEESGGNPHVIGGFAKEIELPNSKIKVQIPTRRFVINRATNQGHGVIPDHIIKPAITDILKNEDAELRFTLKEIIK